MSSTSISTGTTRRNTALLVTVVILLLVGLPFAVYLDLRELTFRTSRQQAFDTGNLITDIRTFYANDIVARIQQGPDARTQIVPNYHDIPGAIPIPASFSIALGGLVTGRDTAIRYDFVSDFPFARREPYQLTPFQKASLDAFRADPELKNTETRAGGVLDPVVEIAFPIRMTEACVACHNAHPDSPKKDWKVGDIRGIQAVTISHPIELSVGSFKFLLIYFAFAAVAGLGIIVLQARQARAIGVANRELANANDFLAAVSMKISKYLSPNIYKQIFSGQRDVRIATERKKLTIFFSDIKDFTATAEHMQPEEFTALLNEYLTEMTTIALQHGATLDKYIGDAILCFFGDPETRGVAEDAKACVAMALAMQARLKELNVKWRARGIDTPFQTRMGINTGYCNVGNFGSEDRMDYTIVGAEANLAARLQQISEPGGLVLSYETYSLVRESVRARRLEPITMKGISQPVVPYAVDPATDAELSLIEPYQGGLFLRLDLSKIEHDRMIRFRNRLVEALAEVNMRRDRTIPPGR